MRSTILLGSTFSGAVLGIFIGVLALGVLVVVAGALPAATGRWTGALRVPVLLLCLVALPVFGAILGYLEGTLKLE